MKKNHLKEPATKGDLKKEFKKYDSKLQKQLDEDFGQVFKRLTKLEDNFTDMSKTLQHVVTTVDSIKNKLESDSSTQNLKIQVANHEKRITKLENL